MRDTIKMRGISGLYQGVHIFLFGLIIFRGTYFGIYDSLKVKTDNEITRWIFSYFAMFMGILMAYPSDSIRRRIVSSGNKYPGMLRGLGQVWRNEGLKGVFLGWQMIFLQSLTGCTFFYFYDKLFTDYSMARE
jgi:solute carrier family 25 (adenine nucleotide translocator) protein 4/5/6/31